MNKFGQEEGDPKTSNCLERPLWMAPNAKDRIKKRNSDDIICIVQKETINVQYERSEADLRNVKIYREDENHKYSHEIEKLNSEITSLKTNEMVLMKNVDELKVNLSNITSERDEILEQNENYQNELENIQKILYDETESASKSGTKVVLLTRQLDEEQKRATEAIHQLDDIRMQLKSSLMTNDTLKTESNQARSLIQEHIIKVFDFCFFDYKKN